jgi:ABC-type dipeptide/oligopeptide/nickel transport system ATPase subunit
VWLEDSFGLKIAALGAASAVMILGWTVSQLFPTQILRLFVPAGSELIPLGVRALRIFTLAFPVIGFPIMVLVREQKMKRLNELLNKLRESNGCKVIRKGMDVKNIRERSDLLVKQVDLQNARKRPLRTYSKGMVQRAGLAMALIHNPDVVILDEPMSGLDPIGRKMVGDLLVELKGQGKTVFFSTHILNDIERFSDRAGIIIGGKLKRVDTLQNLLSGVNNLEDVFMREVALAEGGAAA